jgi:hypothetical protein
MFKQDVVRYIEPQNEGLDFVVCEKLDEGSAHNMEKSYHYTTSET